MFRNKEFLGALHINSIIISHEFGNETLLIIPRGQSMSRKALIPIILKLHEFGISFFGYLRKNGVRFMSEAKTISNVAAPIKRTIL